MLSEIAKPYDPVGWLFPTIIVEKLLIQQLWIQELDWDEPVSKPTSHFGEGGSNNYHN